MSDKEEIRVKLENICSRMCDEFCKYPNEPGHEDNPDWLWDEGGPCMRCPLDEIDKAVGL